MPSPIRLRVCGFWAFFDSLIAWGANRANDKDRPTYDRLDDIEAARLLLLHTRQDAKLAAFMLFAILIMLGIIADGLPSH